MAKEANPWQDPLPPRPRAQGEWRVPAVGRLRRDAAEHAYEIPASKIVHMRRPALDELRRGERSSRGRRRHRPIPVLRSAGGKPPSDWQLVVAKRRSRGASAPVLRGLVFNLADQVRRAGAPPFVDRCSGPWF